MRPCHVAAYLELVRVRILVQVLVPVRAQAHVLVSVPLSPVLEQSVRLEASRRPQLIECLEGMA